MEDLYNGNLTDDTTEEEIMALLGLDGRTYLRDNSLARRQYTDTGRFAGCIHVWIPQQFIETVFELNGLSFKKRELVIQSLTEMMKLQQSGKRNNYKPYGDLSLLANKVGRGEEMDIPREGARLPQVKKIGSSNQYQADKPLLGKDVIRPALPTPWKLRPESRYGLTMGKHQQGQNP